MKKIIGLLLFIIIVVVALGYLGFIPGLSSLFGSGPVDLEVRTNVADYESAAAKFGRERVELPADGSATDSIRFEGSHPVDAVFTQEELTATFQTRNWEYNPLSDDTQFRINPDNTIEMSGALIIDNIIAASNTFGFSEDDMSVIENVLGAVKGNPAFHIKTGISIQHNETSLDIQEFKIGKLPIPASVIPADLVEGLVEGILYNAPGLGCESLNVENGQVHFKGTYPDKTYYRS